MKKTTETGFESMAILLPGPGKCRVCAGAHDPAQPHNKFSLYYRMRFRQRNGRYPNWTDAMEHCAEEVKAWWREEFIRHGINMEEARDDDKP